MSSYFAIFRAIRTKETLIMRMLAGDINIYWQHETLTPHTVREEGK